MNAKIVKKDIIKTIEIKSFVIMTRGDSIGFYINEGWYHIKDILFLRVDEIDELYYRFPATTIYESLEENIKGNIEKNIPDFGELSVPYLVEIKQQLILLKEWLKYRNKDSKIVKELKEKYPKFMAWLETYNGGDLIDNPF